MEQAVSHSLSLVYYGDDFTGSTDSLEALALAGVKTVLFLKPPDPELLFTRFSDLQCFGVAGVSRAMTASQMDTELQPVLSQLRQTRAPIVHYKVCSTFDSSSEIGSIGKVIDIGKALFPNQRTIPLLVGAPVLGRYTVFGNHFASSFGDIYRLDRHPVMSRHPVTPMDEADLRWFLHRQTTSSIGLMNVLDLDGPLAAVYERFDNLKMQGEDVVLFDVVTDVHMRTIGNLIWRETNNAQQFVVGSSGVEYALTAYWKSQGIISETSPTFTAVGSVGPLLVISGSCSHVTKRQIEWAAAHGFICVRVPAEWLTSVREDVRKSSEQQGQHRPQPGARWFRSEIDPILEEAVTELNRGRSVVLYTALGPDDPSIERTRHIFDSEGVPRPEVSSWIGRQLGRLTREIVLRTAVRRLLIAGGDTAGFTVNELDMYGLQMLAPIAPGSPLCLVHAEDPRFDKLQVALKGGQVGREDYFGRVQTGCRQ